MLHDELHCDPAHLPAFVADDEPEPPSPLPVPPPSLLDAASSCDASSFEARAADTAAAADAADVLLLAGALSSRCASAKLSVDGAGGLVIIISSSSSEWTRSLTMPEVVFDEVEEMTEMRWSQSHLEAKQCMQIGITYY